MKRIFFLLCLICLGCANLLIANGERRKPRVPPVTIESAVKLVYEFHEKSANALKPIFVDEATFVREEGTAYWKIGVRHTEFETGHLYYTVSTEGTVAMDSVVKDG